MDDELQDEDGEEDGGHGGSGARPFWLEVLELGRYGERRDGREAVEEEAGMGTTIAFEDSLSVERRETSGRAEWSVHTRL